MLKFCKQCVKTSTGALLANKGRSFLTMLGIIIGVSAVVIIMAVGAGAQSLILSQIKSLGTNLIGVIPGKSENNGPPAQALGIVITTLTYDDAKALADKKNAPNLEAVSAYSKDIATVSWGANAYDTNISGTSASYVDVEGGEIELGRFFTAEEEKNLSRVVVLGSMVKDQLFGESYPVGQRIKIKKQTFEVIGAMKKRGTVAFQNYDDQVFIPVVTMQKIISGVNHLGFIRAKVDGQENIDRAINDITITLRERHNISDQSSLSDDFTVRSAAQALDIITTVTNALKFFLAAMAALSLLVGGIGIMNIMLVSVTERTREIGLRKAVGASNNDIMLQFLMEASTITLTGGIIGVIIGSLISVLISVGANLLGYDWDLVISLFSMILALAVSVSIGLIFGLYPARKASKLQPVEALRHE
ncbi:ABC transporter permease [Candidatus Falkowbacteria bacterium]|nr:ABC transporter permease [Candidatus Falkowbacteria bacterium]